MGKKIILNQEETNIIIKLYESGQTLKEISKDVNLCRITISNILGLKIDPKNDIPNSVWIKMKENINEYFI